MAPGASPVSERSAASDVRLAPRNRIVSGVAQRPAAAGSCARAVAPRVIRATATQKRRVITTIYTEKGRQDPLTWTLPAPGGFPRPSDYALVPLERTCPVRLVVPVLDE